MKNIYILILGTFFSAAAFAQESTATENVETVTTETPAEAKPITRNVTDKVEMETTTIKGNTELPKILYLVPWKSVEVDAKSQHQLILHSLYGDVFTPQAPEAPANNK
jgi:hypothetical protein